MYPKTLKEIENVAVRSRIAIERRIVRSLVNELLSHEGFALAVNDGGETHPKTMNKKKLFSQLCETDQDWLLVFKVGSAPARDQHLGTIMLVYGNDGWDVMSDWHTSLDAYMPNTLALVDKLS